MGKPAEGSKIFLRVERAAPRTAADGISSGEQASRCMDCGTPFCHWGCPAGSHIPEWNGLLARGMLESAVQLLETTNPFPEITGRLCPAPCEGRCLLGRDFGAVTVRENELGIIEKAFKNGLVKPSPPARRSRGKTAVIGSGPAGLSAAFFLNRRGFKVVVYEKNDQIGGLLRYGIPDFKLERAVLDRRLELMSREGILFEVNAGAGEEIEAGFLLEKFDAVCLAGGCTAPRDLKIPGRNLGGIHFALDYLSQANRRTAGRDIPTEELIDAGNKRTVVIGGGDTGSDCVETACRQGAASIVQIEIMPRPGGERPKRQPGGKKIWGAAAEAFAGKENRVSEIRCARLSHSRRPGGMETTRIPGSEFAIRADIVLIAAGFSSAGGNAMAGLFGLGTDERGNVRTDSSFKTSSEKIFCAGDMRRGPSLIASAVSEGRECARAISAFLGEKGLN